MLDKVRGPVTNVVDGDTFDMRVDYRGDHNKFKYNNEERVRIADIDAPELRSPGGKRSQDSLERAILGKVVQCHVKARDEYGRIVARVEIV